MCAKKFEKEEEKQFILDFIEVYRSLPILWDIDRKDYRDREKREKAVKVLVTKYKERYPEADKHKVLRKINILRSNFRRKLKSLNELSKNGVGDSSVTDLWYFDALSFIRNINTRNTESSRDEIIFFDEDSQMKSEYSAEEEFVYDEEPKSSKRQRLSTNEEFLDEELHSKRMQYSEVEDDIHLKSKSPKKYQNSFGKISEIWAMKLQNMDPNQALIAEKLINDIFFYGQMGKLYLGSNKLKLECEESDPLNNNSNGTNKEVEVIDTDSDF